MTTTDAVQPVPPTAEHAAPFWTLRTVAAAAGGRWQGADDPADAPLTGVTIDSRRVEPGRVFVAVRGDRHDGHEFAGQAGAKGAALIIASRPLPAGERPVPVLIVEDTRRALGRIASAYRDHLGGQGALFIAVCGSNGKTTTVRIIERLLRTGLCGTASEQSFNNDLGVPLTILSARAGDQFVLCEVGSNAPGEIDTLGKIVRPDMAVITSIGREHLEGFGGLEGVMREEGAIARHLRPGGTLLYAEAAPLPDGRTFEGLLRTFTNPFSTRVLEPAYWLRRAAPCTWADGRAGVAWKDLNGLSWRVPLPGVHNASNAMLGVWVAQAMGIDNEAIATGLEGVAGPPMRQQVSTAGPVTIVNDAYNANPDSVLASLASFADLTPTAQRRVVVLGPMRELGAAEAAAHREVLDAAVDAPGVGAVIVAGEPFAVAARSLPEGALLAVEPSLDDGPVAALAGYIKPGDAVLIKGSRSTAMERVARAIEARFAPAAPGARAARGKERAPA